MNPQITMGLAHVVLLLTSFVTNGAVSAFLLAYAKEMQADVRTSQYLVQVGCFVLSFLLFGVAGGCLAGVFAYPRK